MGESIKNSKSYIWATAILVLVIIAGGIFYYYHRTNAFPVGAALTVTINNCDSISPQTVTIVEGGTVAFNNIDKTDHLISVGGNPITVPAGGSANLVAKLQYGSGTYGYTCDGKLSSNEIVVVAVPGSALMSPISFKSIYDGKSASVQACLKVALGSEFDKSYNDVNYIPSVQAMNRVDNCLGTSGVPVATASSTAK